MEQKAICRAIRRYECTPKEIIENSERSTKRAIDKLLDRGVPCIVSVEHSRHWAVLSGRDGATYYWIDSSDDDLVGESCWSDLAEWMADTDDDNPFYALGVVPKDQSWLPHSLVHRFGEAWEYMDDADLRKYWGFYVSELNLIFDASPGTGLSAQQFFSKYEAPILSAVASQVDEDEADRLAWELDCLRKVATAHRMYIDSSFSVEAVARLALLVSQLP